MKIVEFATKRPVTITMFTLAILIFGLISFDNLSIDLLPDITFPTLTVRTEYDGSAPGEVENLISKPIEEALGIVSGVSRVSSISRPGLSDVVLEFNWGTNMDFAAIDVREKLDNVNLPRDATKPVLLRFDPSLDPIMKISLYGEKDLVTLRLLAEEDVKRRLENIEGVAAIKISGGLEEEIYVELNEARLAYLGIPVAQVINRLGQENVNLTGGTLKEGEAEYLVRTLNQFTSIEEIADIVVGGGGGATVTLKDVGGVYKSNKERKTITRTNGVESVEIAVFKEADTNTVAVSSAVGERLSEIENDLKNLSYSANLEVISDQAKFIRESIWEVLKTALWGGGLAIFILYLFLRNIRSTGIVGLAIPISVVAAFFLMFASNISLNIMSLGGIALGVGMLVDNSIVVLESISRHRAKGRSPYEAANVGTSEVGRAVIAATLTTICVFFPIIFVQGVAGQLFIDQALTVTYSLIASLIVALTLIPMLSSIQIRRESTDSVSPENSGLSIILIIMAFPFRLIGIIIAAIRKVLNIIFTPIYFLFDRVFSFLVASYEPSLRWALSHKGSVIVSALGFLLASLLLFGLLGTELIPEVSQGEFNLSVRIPPGTPISETEDQVKVIEGIVIDKPEVGRVYSVVGSSGGFGLAGGEERENIGSLNIALDGIRGAREDEVMADLRAEFGDIPGVEYRFSRPSLFTFRTPIEIEIKGHNLNVLQDLTERISQRMTQIPGLTDIRSSMEGGNPEVQITFDRRRIAAMGLDTQSIGQIIREKVQGEVATEYSQGDRKIDIRVRARQEDIAGLNELERLTVENREGVLIPLTSLAQLNIERGPREIRRVDQERVALVTANIAGRDLGSVIEDIQGVLSEFAISGNYIASVGGQSREMTLSFNSLRFAILLAVFLVYLVMAAQFESLIHPLVILFSIPFGLTGVILILLITGVSVSVVVLIGVVMLAGIVVNNAIVLVDYINRLRREGMEKIEAIIEAGKIRLRPIMMTTTTTVLGLLPMSLGFGEGAEIRSPMAIAVIGGLLMSTLLTLLFIPTVYALFDQKKNPKSKAQNPKVKC